MAKNCRLRRIRRMSFLLNKQNPLINIWQKNPKYKKPSSYLVITCQKLAFILINMQNQTFNQTFSKKMHKYWNGLWLSQWNLTKTKLYSHQPPRSDFSMRPWVKENVRKQKLGKFLRSWIFNLSFWQANLWLLIEMQILWYSENNLLPTS